MRTVFLLACLLVAPPALASGGFSCVIDDGNLKLSVDSGFSHGVGEQLLNFRGTLDLPAKLAPDGLRRVALDSATLPHHWLYDRELRLRIYAETPGEPFGSVDLALLTAQAADDETQYAGRYVLTVYSAKPLPGAADTTIEKRGTVSCSVE